MLNMFIRIITLVSILAVASAIQNCYLGRDRTEPDVRGQIKIYYYVRSCVKASVRNKGKSWFEVTEGRHTATYSARPLPRFMDRIRNKDQAVAELNRRCFNKQKFKFDPITGPTWGQACQVRQRLISIGTQDGTEGKAEETNNRATRFWKRMKRTKRNQIAPLPFSKIT
jgi:hypothetical protein